MSMFDRHPHWFQVGFGILAGLLLLLAFTSLFKIGSAPTDENWFRDPPSAVYVTGSIPAARNGMADSLRVGDLIVAVDGTKTLTLHSLDEIMHKGDGRPITVVVHRLDDDRDYSYTVVPSVLQPGNLLEARNAAYVFDVPSGGASDRAGMKKGDLILRINGKTFTNVGEADRLMRQGQAGKAIDYEVLRLNQVVTLHVTLASFGLPFSILVMVLSGLLFMGTGIFVGEKRPKIPAARLLALFLVTSGFSITVLLLGLPDNPELWNRLRGILAPVGLLLAIPLAHHMRLYLPKEKPALLSRSWLKWAGYAVAAAIVPFVFLFGDRAFTVGLLGLFVLFLIARWLTRNSVDAEARIIMRPIAVLSTAAGVVTMLIIIAINSTGTFSPSFVIGYVGFPLALIPAGYIYAIGRHHLFDIDLRIRRNLQYGFAAAAWRLATFFLYCWILVDLFRWKPVFPGIRLGGGVFEILDTVAPPEQQDLLRSMVLSLCAILITYVFWRVGQRGLRLIEERFHRARYDYRLAAAELGNVMSTRLSMSGLARGVVEKLGELMRVKRVGVLFFRNRTDCCCEEAYGFDGTEWKEFCVSAGDDIAAALENFQGPSSIDYFPREVKAAFRNEQFHLAVPIRSQAKLIGAILVGEKLSETTFHQGDFDFLTSAATQASVAIENAFLYEELAEQERLKHELALARRIQLESLPQTTPDIQGLDLAGISIPATEVGGDYFDYLNGDSTKLTVVVGDVSGKGTSAALYMSKVQGILRSLHGFGLAPRELFIRANELLYRDMERKSFVTAIGAMFDTKVHNLALARAGHLPLYYFSAAARQVRRIVPRGIGLGLKSGGVFNPELEELVIPYQRGDVFLFVTDGITEARAGDGEQFGEQRLENLLLDASSFCALEVRDRLLSAVSAFVGDSRQFDDQTAVVVKANEST